MQPRCTCGAVLPEDARFCHKCGKPQFEEDAARLTALEAAATPTPTPSLASQPPSGISFHNSRAVLISLLVAGVALIGLMATGLLAPPLLPFVLCGAGFMAARVYKGQTREPLTTAGGARLGWMTGLWLFLVVAVICALTAILIASPQGWDQLKASWARFPQAAKLMELSQHDILMQLLLGLPFSFFLLTLLPGLGGILGAKMSAGRRPS